ncbi:CoA transferase [Sphingobacterium siyangense]|uniref:CoA transferase family III n=1 Tax=Sphingobacterium siyangense TaxID=459529 RepID=A0A562MKC9_9SPHI|nr:CoA transferase [Sphingobacterium siyangense]TWI20326.1 CoA transferase family III [Sphingobacterium siyangense]
MTLNDKIKNALDNPLKTTEGFDLNDELEKLLNEIGLTQKDSGGNIEFTGKDPIVKSVFRLASASAIVLAAKAVSIAMLWKQRSGNGQNIKINLGQALHRLSPFYDKKWEFLNGFNPEMPNDPTNPFMPNFIYETADNKHVLCCNLYPRLKTAALRFLDCADSQEAVAAAIKKWNALDLEKAMNEKGLQLTIVRTPQEFLSEQQYLDLLEMPLIEITKIGDSEPEPLPQGGENPLDGIRALGMGHVIAGAGAGRALALHGADVLNIWPSHDFEIDLIYYTTAVGQRSATLNLKKEEGLNKMKSLLKDTDVFFHNRRPGYMDNLGLNAEEAAKIRPGIIHAGISLWGSKGPWTDRIGFDQNAGAATGVFALEGTADQPKLSEIFVVNDYIMSWLTTIGINVALARRAKEGGSYKVHVSLVRASMWLFSLGIFDKEYAHATAGSSPDHYYTDPETFVAETPCGTYQGVTEQVYMSETPGFYKTVLVPRGSGKPEWLDR